MKRLVVVVAFVPVLLAASCEQNVCDHPPPEVGGLVVDAQAIKDPCAGQPVNHVIAWFTRQGARYPLRCGRRDPRGFGYVHIRYDEGRARRSRERRTFRGEVANTLQHGIEQLASGGTPR